MSLLIEFQNGRREQSCQQDGLMSGHLKVASLLVLAFGLMACGGGGSGGSSNNPNPPTQSPPPPPPQRGALAFQTSESSESEDEGSIAITVSRTGGSDGEVSATLTFSGTANSGSDFTAPNTVTFANGATSATVTISPIDDDQAEADETLVVTLTSPAGGATLGTTNSTTLTIVNDDVPEAPAVALSTETKALVFTWAAVPGATFYRLWSKPDGVSEFTQALPDISGAQARLPIAVHQINWWGETYKVSACNAIGCTDSSELVAEADQLLDTIGILTGSNSDSGDTFGSSVALSADGSTFAVGAYNEDSSARGVNGEEEDEFAENSGAVYVFTRASSGEWEQQAYIKASNSAAGAGFGAAISLSDDGDTLAVGALGERSSATGVNGNQTNASLIGAGAAYVFRRDEQDEWAQTAYIKASNTDASDRFGKDLSLSGDGMTLAVGADGEDSAAVLVNGADDNSDLSSGAVYVFELQGSGWTQVAYVKPHIRLGAGTSFGQAVALDEDGDTLAIASLLRGLYVYVRGEDGWQFETVTQAGLRGLGDDVAISGDGNTIVVSNAYEIVTQPQNNFLPGAAYVFTRTEPGVWNRTATLRAQIVEYLDYFGRWVAISDDGQHIVVAAPNEDSSAIGIDGDPFNENAQGSGAAYHFTRNEDGTWTQGAYIKAPFSDESLGFSNALALSGDGAVLIASGSDEIFLY